MPVAEPAVLPCTSTGYTYAEPIPLEGLWDYYHRARHSEHAKALMKHYLPMLQRIAANMASRLPAEVDADELMQEGLFGLSDAIAGFDPSREVQFTTFAGHRIAGAIRDYLRTLDLLPRLARDRYRKYEKAKQAAKQTLGRDGTDDELRNILGVDPTEYDRIRRDAEIVRVTSMHVQTGDDDSPVDLGDTIKDDRQILPESIAQRDDLKQIITKDLSRAERLIVILYYYEQMSMKEIGMTLDLSESRVSQMHASILARLRARFASASPELLAEFA